MPGRLGAFIGIQVTAGANQNLVERLGDALGRSGFQHFFDLACGASIRVAFDRDDDALPDGDVAGLQRFADRRRGPELDGSLVDGHRQLASSRVATASDRHRVRTSSHCAAASGVYQRSSSAVSAGTGSASRLTNWVAIHIRCGFPEL